MKLYELWFTVKGPNPNWQRSARFNEQGSLDLAQRMLAKAHGENGKFLSYEIREVGGSSKPLIVQVQDSNGALYTVAAEESIGKKYYTETDRVRVEVSIVPKAIPSKFKVGEIAMLLTSDFGRCHDATVEPVRVDSGRLVKIASIYQVDTLQKKIWMYSFEQNVDNHAEVWLRKLNATEKGD